MNDKSNEKLNNEYDKIVEIVTRILKLINNQFKKLGIKEFKKIEKPSLQDLQDRVKELQIDVVKLEDKLLSSKSNEVAINTIRLQNIKLGLLYADSLLSGVKNENTKECKEYIDKLDKNNI